MSIQERDRIRQIGGFVATALGEGWKVDTSADLDHGVHIDRTDGARIFLRIGTYGAERDRLIIHGDYPGTYDQKRVTESHQISCAADKDPKRIAGEIERRLLPKYLVDLDKVRAVIAADERAAESKATALAALAEVGATETNGRVYINLPGIYGHIDLHHDGSKGRIEVGAVPLNGLIQAIKAIRQSMKEDQQ